MCANFQLKQTTLTFLDQICPKRKLVFEIQKTNVGVTISIFKIPLYQFLDKTDMFDFFGPSFPKNRFCGENFKNFWIWNQIYLH